ncbi:MAG TPA: DNA-binding response regulator, partial [Selenomonas sp.]|nr:DNA-binding response regulator [Selenomonas sp.]
MKKILIVEDDIDIAELERDYFEAAGFAATIETDGRRGQEAALTGGYDLVVLDLMLPG